MEFDEEVLIAWLEDNCEYRNRSGNEYNFSCPFCGGTEFYINIGSGKWVCHHEKRCGRRGHKPAGLVSDVEGIGYYEALKLLAGGAAIVSKDAVAQLLTVKQEEVAPVLAPSEQVCNMTGMVPLHPKGEGVHRQAMEYIHERGFDTEWFGKNYYPWVGVYGRMVSRLILPHYRKGHPIFYQGRDLTGVAEQKYLNPYNNELKVRRKDLLWNEIRLNHPQKLVVVVEGIFKAIAFERAGYGAVAAYGASISDAQLSQLVASPTRVFVVAPDRGDLARHRKNATSFAELWREKVAKRLADYGKTVLQVVPFPYHDYDEVEVEELHKAMCQARPIIGPYAV